MIEELSILNQTFQKDSALIKELNKGSQQAFSSLYNKYMGMVYGFLLKILKDEESAEDLTQFCFMQIWINRKRISTEKNFPAYLYVIAKNAAYKEFRRNLTAESYMEDSILSQTDYTSADEGNIDFKLIRKEVNRVISELPESRKKIYLMSRFEGLKTTEIAQQLNISPKTVDAQISRVKLSLRKAISKIIILSCIGIMTNETAIIQSYQKNRKVEPTDLHY